MTVASVASADRANVIRADAADGQGVTGAVRDHVSPRNGTQRLEPGFATSNRHFSNLLLTP
jgi:hypothetical protein